MTDTFDYIVVGSGSAGAALAARLSEDGRHAVLLLEAGPPEGRAIVSRIPMAVVKMLESAKFMRQFYTEPDPQMNDRKIFWPRGWVVGGSSTVNGMMWVHGTPKVYDAWHADGCPGWSYADVLPWLRKIEDYPAGDTAYRGHGGPVTVTQFKPVDALPDAFVDGVAQAGIAPKVKDFNAGGFGAGRVQLNTRNGVRCNTRMAYLDEALQRPNLTLKTGVMVSRVVLEGKKAVAVRARMVAKNGAVQELEFKARREIILSGGAYNSPQLLELSGIGRADVLNQAGVPVLHELAMVGENLSEHVYTSLSYRAKPGVSWNRDLSSPWGNVRLGLGWLLKRNGPLSSVGMTACAFVPTEIGGKDPDLKIQVQQLSTSYARGEGKITLDKEDGITLGSFQICPRSRGSSHITNSDPLSNPRMLSNHLTHADDLQACLTGLKHLRATASAPTMQAVLKDELRPGHQHASDESLIAHIRATGGTAYHPVGTCRMGNDAAQSVVDTELRVHGLQGLRIADASVMPSIASTNTNAICIAIGERAAHFILKEFS